MGAAQRLTWRRLGGCVSYISAKLFSCVKIRPVFLLPRYGRGCVHQLQKRVAMAIDRATDPQAAGGVKVFKLKISYGVIHGFHLFERLKPLL